MCRSRPRPETPLTARMRFSQVKNAASSPGEWYIGPLTIRTSTRTSVPHVEVEQLALLLDVEAVGHAGDVVADHAGAAGLVAALGAGAPLGGQHVRFGHEQLEHLRQDAAGLAGGGGGLSVPVTGLHPEPAPL